MKVGVIINILKANNTYQKKIFMHTKQYQYYEAFDDTYGMKSEQEKINELNDEYGKFLDIEI